MRHCYSKIPFIEDRLSNYDEIEWYQFQQLTEVVLMQESGPREAVEAVRKRLKHGTSQQKLRVLEVRYRTCEVVGIFSIPLTMPLLVFAP